MSKLHYSQALKQLIPVMGKSEKRHFKLYSRRNASSKKDFQFVQLFDAYDRDVDVSDQKLLKKFEGFSSKQLADLKRHLYWQLLECLRIYHSNKGRLHLSGQVDIARILYNKGLFLESLNILEQVKKQARAEQENILVYEIIEFETEIESRHVTHSHASRAVELREEMEEIRAIIQSEADWSAFALNLYAKYLQVGHVKDQEELEAIQKYYMEERPAIQRGSEHFFHRLYMAQARQWYNYIIQNFANCYRHCQTWIGLFDEFPNFKERYPHLLIKGYHNCLSVLFYCLDSQRHQELLDRMQVFCDDNRDRFNRNTELMSFTYLSTAQLNQIILSGRFSEGRAFLEKFEEDVDRYGDVIDDHRLMVFWYKMASIYFTMGDYRQCNRLLNRIINSSLSSLREDVQCYARLLNLIAHFELENDEFLSHSIKSTYRFLLKMNENMKFHQIVIRFLRTALFKERHELRKPFSDLKEEFVQLEDLPLENRSFLYLDAISWLESKIDNESVETIIFRKRKLALS